MTRTFVKTLAGIGIAASTLLGSSAAQAQSASISYRPYELAAATGSQAVFDRIQRAAKRACRQNVGAPEFFARGECQADLTQQMVLKIDHPRVTALLTGQPEVRLASRSR